MLYAVSLSRYVNATCTYWCAVQVQFIRGTQCRADMTTQAGWGRAGEEARQNRGKSPFRLRGPRAFRVSVSDFVHFGSFVGCKYLSLVVDSRTATWLNRNGLNLAKSEKFHVDIHAHHSPICVHTLGPACIECDFGTRK